MKSEQNIVRDQESFRIEQLSKTKPAIDAYEGRDPYEALREAEAQRPEILWPTWNDDMRGRERG